LPKDDPCSGTVYECPSCWVCYLGEQCCPDYQLFCRRDRVDSVHPAKIRWPWPMEMDDATGHLTSEELRAGCEDRRGQKACNRPVIPNPLFHGLHKEKRKKQRKEKLLLLSTTRVFGKALL